MIGVCPVAAADGGDSAAPEGVWLSRRCSWPCSQTQLCSSGACCLPLYRRGQEIDELMAQPHPLSGSGSPARPPPHLPLPNWLRHVCVRVREGSGTTGQTLLALAQGPPWTCYLLPVSLSFGMICQVDPGQGQPKYPVFAMTFPCLHSSFSFGENRSPPSSWPHPSGQRAQSVPFDCLGFDCLGHEHAEDSLLFFPSSLPRARQPVDDTQLMILPRVQTLAVPPGLSWVPTAVSGGGLSVLGGVMEDERGQGLTG